MRARRQKPDDTTNPLFTNTRSRLYQKKNHIDTQDSGVQSSDSKTGAYWKQKGNEAFKVGNYAAAIQCYSKAIQINPGESQYYSNRSKCYQKQRQLEKSLKDAETACQLEDQNIKAHYICGCILAEMGKKDNSKLKKAENRLKKALRLCRTKSAHEYEEEISIKLFRCKKLTWFKEKQQQLSDLMTEKEIVIKAFNRQEITQVRYNSIIQKLNEEIEDLKQHPEIPDHLICKITLMLMQDPVVSEEGFSYERKVLEEHYSMKGPIEPITRKQVSGKIFPNHALKQAIEIFLRDNPWAFEEEKGEDYYNITFI